MTIFILVPYCGLENDLNAVKVVISGTGWSGKLYYEKIG